MQVIAQLLLKSDISLTQWGGIKAIVVGMLLDRSSPEGHGVWFEQQALKMCPHALVCPYLGGGRCL
jgi:hypothetical protein